MTGNFWESLINGYQFFVVILYDSVQFCVTKKTLLHSKDLMTCMNKHGPQPSTNMKHLLFTAEGWRIGVWRAS